jgi:hypothetical protein
VLPALITTNVVNITKRVVRVKRFSPAGREPWLARGKKFFACDSPADEWAALV